MNENNAGIKQKHIKSGQILGLPAYIINLDNSTIPINGYVQVDNVEFMICLYLEDKPDLCHENKYMKQFLEMHNATKTD